MVIAAFVVSLLAITISGLSAWYSRSQAVVSARADLRARRPRLTVELESSAKPGETALYYVENRGDEDLDSVIVYKPFVPDGVSYPVARMGYASLGDEADLGRIDMRSKVGFVLQPGPAPHGLPQFRVRVRSRIGKDTWEDVFVLSNPRYDLGIY